MAPTPTEKQKCSKKVWKAGVWGHRFACKRFATVTRENRPFCTQHDPVRVAKEQAERYEAKRKKWDGEYKYRSQQQLLASASQELFEALEKLEKRADYLTRLHNGSEVGGPRGTKSWAEDAEKAIADVEDATASARLVLAKVKP